MSVREIVSGPPRALSGTAMQEPVDVFCDVMNPRSLSDALERMAGDGDVILHLSAIPGVNIDDPISIVLAMTPVVTAEVEGLGN